MTMYKLDYAALDTAPERMVAEAHVTQLRGLGVLVEVEPTDRICYEHLGVILDAELRDFESDVLCWNYLDNGNVCNWVDEVRIQEKNE